MKIMPKQKETEQNKWRQNKRKKYLEETSNFWMVANDTINNSIVVIPYKRLF